MKSIWLYVSLFISLVLEVSVLRLPGLSHWAVNIVVWCLVMIGILRGPKAGLVAGIVIGLVQDASYGTFLGETALAYALTGYMAGYVRSLVLRDSLVLAILLTGIGTEVFSWVTYATSRFFGEVTVVMHPALQESARSALSTMVLCLLLYIPFYRMFVRKKRVGYGDESAEA
ncbi:MAG: rod shape-determining protein MreD [Firmicutes bacterium]|nr:rod shape-determining protein MreD [Bacillota bacterium]